MSRYEHLVCDITPAALRYVGVAGDSYIKGFSNIKSETLIELENFRNEIGARLQRIASEAKSMPNGDLI